MVAIRSVLDAPLAELRVPARYAGDLFALVAADRARLLAAPGASIPVLRLFELLPRHPILSVAAAQRLLETTKPTATRAIGLLVESGVLAETSGRKYDRSYTYRAYVERLRTGTELDEV